MTVVGAHIVATLVVIMMLSVVSVFLWRFWVADPQRRPPQGVSVTDTGDRAETYLRRIVALTGAIRVGLYYVLNVGKTRFEVHDSYVRRTPSTADPTATLRETCFYLPNQHMPAAEKIATALLQLKNNPRLFERWADRIGVFKADGELASQANTNRGRATFL